MLTEKTAMKNSIENVCAESGDVAPGERFRSAVTAEDLSFPEIPGEAEIVCCGKVSGDEMLFRTEDGRIYFSVRDGWGGKDGILYGMTPGFRFDLGCTTNRKTLQARCRLFLKRRSCRITGLTTALRFSMETKEIEKILSVEGGAGAL